MQRDLESAAFAIAPHLVQQLFDSSIPTNTKWPIFEQLWKATQHTAYTQVTNRVLRDTFGEEELTYAALGRVKEKLPNMDETAYFATIEQSGIKAMLADVLGWIEGGLRRFLDGTITFPAQFYPLVPLPLFHPVIFNGETIQWVESLANYDMFFAR